MLLLEPVNDILQGRIVVEREPVPEGPLYVAILLLLSCDRLGKAEEGQGEVDETVFEVLQLVLAVDELHERPLSRSHIAADEHHLRTLYSSKQTRPVISEVVVAIAGIIFPAICFVVCRSAGLIL